MEDRLQKAHAHGLLAGDELVMVEQPFIPSGPQLVCVHEKILISPIAT
jgi:hypothetical protein